MLKGSLIVAMVIAWGCSSEVAEYCEKRADCDSWSFARCKEELRHARNRARITDCKEKQQAVEECVFRTGYCHPGDTGRQYGGGWWDDCNSKNRALQECIAS
jgi:hypothetical protein